MHSFLQIHSSDKQYGIEREWETTGLLVIAYVNVISCEHRTVYCHFDGLHALWMSFTVIKTDFRRINKATLLLLFIVSDWPHDDYYLKLLNKHNEKSKKKNTKQKQNTDRLKVHVYTSIQITLPAAFINVDIFISHLFVRFVVATIITDYSLLICSSVVLSY